MKPFCLTADIQIKQNGEGISVYAASYGLHEVYFDKKSWKVKAKRITLVFSLKAQEKQKRPREMEILLKLRSDYSRDPTMQIKVVDWMKGKTCGLCGKADGETMQEYRTPTGWIATTAVSFAHSWILPAESCRDATGMTQRYL